MNQNRSRSGLRQVLACVGKAICYLTLFLGWQVIVSMACTYSAMYELSMGGVFPQDYWDGLWRTTAGALFAGVVLVVVAAVVLRVKRKSLRGVLGLREQAGTPLVAAAAAAAVVCWLGVLILLARVEWQMSVGMLYLSTTAMGGPMLDETVVYDTILTLTGEISAVSGVLTLATIVFIMKVRRKSLRRELWLRPVPGKLLGWGAGLAFCLYWLVTLVLSFLPEEWMASYMEESAALSDLGLLTILATAIIAPVVEEVVFRGLVYTRLQRGMQPLAAVIAAALLFGYCHGEFIWFCYATVLGLIFTQVTRYTGSILPAVVMHVVFNTTNEVLALVGEWEPGVTGWLAILVVALAGSLFCALRLRDAVSRFQPPAETEPEPAVPSPEPPAAEPIPTEVSRRPARAMWDEDSGPDHRFPPERR